MSNFNLDLAVSSTVTTSRSLVVKSVISRNGSNAVVLKANKVPPAQVIRSLRYISYPAGRISMFST